MIVSIWTGELKPGKLDEMNQHANEKLAPLLQEVSGLKKFVMGVDRATNKVTMVALWASEEAASALRSSPQFMQGLGEAQQFYTSPIGRQAYEVVFEV